MATRLDLGGLLNKAQNPYEGLDGGSPRDLFEGLFKPGDIYTGFKGPTNMPELMDSSSVMKKGGFAGLNAFDSHFGQDGSVSDPLGLLKAMNAGEVLSYRPKTRTYFEREYGGAPDDRYDPGLGILGTMYGGIAGAAAGMFGKDDPNRAIEPAYNQSGVNRDLMDWLQGMSLSRKGGGDVAFDPGNLRYKDYNIAPGLNLQNTNRSELEAFAQKTFGVDLETLASSSSKLLETRQGAMANPKPWLNSADPASLNMTNIPGHSDATSALRMQDYSGAITNARNIVGQNNEQQQANALLNFLRSNPEGLSTGYGQYLAGSQEQRVGAAQQEQSAIPPPMDYSAFYQMGLSPDMINLAMSQASMKF